MNKFLLASMAVLLGVLGVATLRRNTHLIRSAAVAEQTQWRSVTNALADSQAAAEALRAEVLDKKNRLKDAMNHPEISPVLLRLLQGDLTGGNLAAWAELRRQLGIGWDASPDYVIVSKTALKQLQYNRLSNERRPADITSDLLGLSPAEQSAMAAAIQRVREGQWGQVQRTEPTGDIVAEYTMVPPDPGALLSISNNYARGIVAAVGQERADLLQPQAWRELSASLAPRETQTIVIRQSVTDGEPDLTCEIRHGGQVSVSPVRYAMYPMYPAGWFLKTFPGGWQDLAKRENFTLPAIFLSQ